MVPGEETDRESQPSLCGSFIMLTAAERRLDKSSFLQYFLPLSIMEIKTEPRSNLSSSDISGTGIPEEASFSMAFSCAVAVAL